jgi:hypothetical protein
LYLDVSWEHAQFGRLAQWAFRPPRRGLIFEEGLNEQGKKEHDFTVEISPGIRTALVNRDELQIVLGVAAPIGLTRPADDHSVFLYFSVEHNFF